MCRKIFCKNICHTESVNKKRKQRRNSERSIKKMKHFYDFETLEEYIEYLFNYVREVEKNEELSKIR